MSSRKKVLIIEDDPAIAEYAEAILSSEYETRKAFEGQEGLALAAEFKPDLVVVDLMLPRMHGYQVCERLRADERLKGTRVLIASSKSYAADIEAGLASGADAYLTKPYQAEALLEKARELLGRRAAPFSVRFWGTRGSLPAPGPQTVRYGGNTACTEVRVGDLLLVIDCGTGVRPLGLALMEEFKGKPITGHLFIGHTHWDHIQGFPFFTPLYDKNNTFTVYSMRQAGRSLEAVLRGQMSSDYFPVPLSYLSCQLRFVEMDGPVDLGKAVVRYHFLNHPGVAVGFRVESEGRSLTYISDHETYARLNGDNEGSRRQDAALVDFIRGSDLLVCEAQYTEEEYALKRGWGHSTFDDVLARAAAAGVKRLLLFHHDPTHTDEMMDAYVERCRKLARESGAALECSAAREGLSVEL